MGATAQAGMSAVVKLVPLDECERGLICRCASEIEPERVEWFWPGRIARGKHTCIAGEPGSGKSQLATAVEATITTGAEWPCGEGTAPQGSVIILSAEDGKADTIVPAFMLPRPILDASTSLAQREQTGMVVAASIFIA
jgi:putative DNA primase/helicase